MADSLPWLLTTIAARTAIVLVALVIGIRLFGRRQLGGMNVYDLVLVLALANAVQNAMTEGSGEVGVGLVSAGTLLILGRALAAAFVRRPALESQVVVGAPTIIASDGQLDPVAMRHEGVSEAEVLAAVREYGLSGLSDVKLAVLEVDGSLSVVPKSRARGQEKDRS
jgi:uncharacterized membrane protein YcaP (DUF421 family)